MARPGFDCAQRHEVEIKVRSVRCGAEVRLPRIARGRSESLPVRRDSQRSEEAMGVQSLRHGLHSGDTHWIVHGFFRGRLCGVLQLWTIIESGGEIGSECPVGAE